MLDVVNKAAEKAGGLRKLAEIFGIQHPSFYDWKQVPPTRVQKISELSGVPPHEIRPDIYPAPAPEDQEALP